MNRAALGACRLTLQAVSEFFHVVTRKGIMPRPDAAAFAAATIDLFETIAASASAVRLALSAAAEGTASYWDALLVATAAGAGCIAILTEDLAPDTTLAGVRVINPFAGGLLSPDAEALLSLD